MDIWHAKCLIKCCLWTWSFDKPCDQNFKVKYLSNGSQLGLPPSRTLFKDFSRAFQKVKICPHLIFQAQDMIGPNCVLQRLGIFSKFKYLLQQANPNFFISLDSMIKLAMKYEKRIFELMVDQKFTWSTLTLTDFDQNDHFAPFDQLELFHSNLNFNPSIMDD